MNLRWIIALVWLGAWGGVQAEESNYPATHVPQKTLYKRQVDKYTFQFGAGAYEATAGLYVNLTDRPVQVVEGKSEVDIYRDLLFNSMNPRHFILAGTVYPVPLLGVGMRKHTPDLYQKFQLNEGINLVESVTAGYEEPYAISAFVGDVVDYSREGANPIVNRGFMGYQFSGGTYHIRHNELIDDHWYQFEWKIEGGKRDEDESLAWSFRPGLKWHSNPEITDTGYLVLRRKQIGFNVPLLSWLFNAGYEFKYEFVQDNFKPVAYELNFDKKIPLKDLGIALSVGLGVIHQTERKYQGALTDTQGDTILVLRPYIEF